MKFSELPRHHAVLLVHEERKELSEKLFNELQSKSLAHRFFDQTVLDIEGVRSIISWANAPYNEEKVGIISFHTIGHEAQNALLKILEEPRIGVRFVLITSNKSALIETVLSRLHHVHLGSGSKTSLRGDAELFLRTKHTSRMKLPCIVELLSRTDEEDRKDKESVRTFILALSDILLEKKEHVKYIPKVMEIASFSSIPSASGKTLLEFLALLLPQTKV